jgi:hypothetical protein
VKGEELFQALATRSLISTKKRFGLLTEKIESRVRLRDKLSHILSSRALHAAAYERHRRLLREGMRRRGHTEEQYRSVEVDHSVVLNSYLGILPQQKSKPWFVGEWVESLFDTFVQRIGLILFCVFSSSDFSSS